MKSTSSRTCTVSVSATVSSCLHPSVSGTSMLAKARMLSLSPKLEVDRAPVQL